MSADTWRALRAALTSALMRAERDSAAADEIARVGRLLARAGAEPEFGATPPRHPVTAHLAPAVAATTEFFPDLAAALHPLAATLPWRYGYAARADLPDLGSRMAYAEIVGPAAPFRSDEVCLGLTFLCAGVVYPAHHHPAVELYRIVAGRPLWTIEDDTRQLSPPGIVLHRSGAAHAMSSQAEAMLAIYSWTGDVLSPSVWSE